ncbi:MAG: hypothetical protein K9K67_13655 [Bacteriovoracaceae bacterium]|nr:hypothetical protein [Bacteriovoracaceae bacterium]
MRYFLTLLFFLSTLSLEAAFSYLNRSAEGLLMGDAFTAVADDEMTLFYNPAALGRNRGVSIVPLKPNFVLPDVLDKDLSFDNPSFGISDRFKNFPTDPAPIADRILGYPVYLEVGAAPAVKVMNFGFNLFAVSKTSMDVQNAIHPVLDVSYRLDRGFILGYAFTGGNGAKGKNPQGSTTSFGIGAKTMNRQGLDNTFDLFGTSLLDIIQNSDNYKTIRKNLGYSKGSGIGFDLGFEYNYYTGPTRYTFGISWLDIGDTSFTKEEGLVDVPDQNQSINLGTSFNQDFGLFDYTLAADYSNLVDATTPALSKLKLGVRARMPILSGYLGYNGGYASWGLGVNIFFLELRVGFYGIELGQKYRQEEGKRTVISLSLARIDMDLF